MAYFGLRLPDELAARFDAFASSRGGRSKALRLMMETATAGTSATPPAVEARGQSAKVTIRLRPAELAALEAASRDAGMRRTEWIVAALRRRLLGQPQLNRKDAEALLDVRRDLRRISVNLNQAVRAMAAAETPQAQQAAHAAELIAFELQVRAQLEAVRAALEGNLAYWDGQG